MATTITMYQGDTLPAYTRTCLDQNGNVINLTGATIAIKFMPSQGGAVITGAGTPTITNAVAGQISYAWAAADTATIGTYSLWVIVTMAGGAKEHSVGPDTLSIVSAP